MKLDLAEKLQPKIVAFNWTKVELKHEQQVKAAFESQTFNWTKLELKLAWEAAGFKERSSF